MSVKLTGLHHVGLTVKDLDRSLEFYRSVFDLEPEFDIEAEGAELGRAVGVADANLRFAFIRIGDAEIELLEYRNPRRESYDGRNCDVGAPHVCLRVSNIETAYQELKIKGITLYSSPFHITGGPLDGHAFFYLKDPDGITLELMQTPDSQIGG